MSRIQWETLVKSDECNLLSDLLKSVGTLYKDREEIRKEIEEVLKNPEKRELLRIELYRFRINFSDRHGFDESKVFFQLTPNDKCETCSSEFGTFCDDATANGELLKEIITDTFINLLNKIQLGVRDIEVSEKLTPVFIMRKEELFGTISSLRKELDEFETESKSMTDAEKMRNYDNNKLSHVATIRSQSIPMYMIELETLASTVRDNSEHSINTAYRLSCHIDILLKILSHKYGEVVANLYGKDD
ncbi:MAG: hypothetical protein ACRC5M_04390 [Anaeroplasmataceae bacterium]